MYNYLAYVDCTLVIETSPKVRTLRFALMGFVLLSLTILFNNMFCLFPVLSQVAAEVMGDL